MGCGKGFAIAALVLAVVLGAVRYKVNPRQPPLRPVDLSKATIIVTGASSGVGKVR